MKPSKIDQKIFGFAKEMNKGKKDRQDFIFSCKQSRHVVYFIKNNACLFLNPFDNIRPVYLPDNIVHHMILL